MLAPVGELFRQAFAQVDFSNRPCLRWTTLLVPGLIAIIHLGNLSKLQTLTLKLTGCPLVNVDVLQALAGLLALQTLKLDLSYCRQLANVRGLAGLVLASATN